MDSDHQVFKIKYNQMIFLKKKLNKIYKKMKKKCNKLRLIK